jgi:methionine synthase II (cobalamin-independent)
MTTHVHLVGSVALDTPQEVFAAAGRLIGPYLKRVPDGEPGGRRLWISWQIPVLRANPSLTPAVKPEPGPRASWLPLRLADGIEPSRVHFGELGYSREARASYMDFLDARKRGELPANVRFQVSLPTPIAVINTFCTPDDAPKILPAYEEAMLREVQRICDAIPHEDLAIQWDVCIEMLAWDGGRTEMQRPPDMERTFGDAFARLGAAVPADVELGFHLCYGDLDGVHFVQPRDAAKMVELANLIARRVQRPITWMHMPVPMDRTDDAYFAPLRGLELAHDTELYLGLVHTQDGVEGTRRRMAVANKYVQGFGIASECGISRARDEQIALEFMRVYAGAAEAGPAELASV